MKGNKLFLALAALMMLSTSGASAEVLLGAPGACGAEVCAPAGPAIVDATTDGMLRKGIVSPYGFFDVRVFGFGFGIGGVKKAKRVALAPCAAPALVGYNGCGAYGAYAPYGAYAAYGAPLEFAGVFPRGISTAPRVSAMRRGNPVADFKLLGFRLLNIGVVNPNIDMRPVGQ
jgi:hypothetical protein